MLLSPARFNRFLAKMGQAVIWRRAHNCPCRDPRSGAPRHDCTLCRNGRIWDPPVCTHLALTGQKLTQAWARFGMWENGDVVCSLASNTPIYKMSDFDRVLFTDSTVPFSHTLTNSGGPQKLPFVATSVDRVLWAQEPALPGGEDTLVNGRIPRLGEDGALSWPSGGGPPVGISYTVSGRKHPEYFCFSDFPQDRAHHGGRALPRKVVLRMFDLYGRGS